MIWLIFRYCRPNTERPESIWYGNNILVNPKSPKFEIDIKKSFNELSSNKSGIKNTKNPFGVGNAAEIIVTKCLEFYTNGKLEWKQPDFINYYPRYSLTQKFVPSAQMTFNSKGFLQEGTDYDKGKYFVYKKKYKH